MWRRRPERPLREELTEAIANVRRQIEVQSVSRPVKGGGYDNRNAMLCAELQAELAELEKALAELEPEGG